DDVTTRQPHAQVARAAVAELGGVDAVHAEASALRELRGPVAGVRVDDEDLEVVAFPNELQVTAEVPEPGPGVQRGDDDRDALAGRGARRGLTPGGDRVVACAIVGTSRSRVAAQNLGLHAFQARPGHGARCLHQRRVLDHPHTLPNAYPRSTLKKMDAKMTSAPRTMSVSATMAGRTAKRTPAPCWIQSTRIQRSIRKPAAKSRPPRATPRSSV